MEECLEEFLTEETQYFTAGVYFPNSFILKLNDKYDFFTMDHNIEAYSTFLHEYIHFLQNIVTSVGINKFNYELVRSLASLYLKYKPDNTIYMDEFNLLKKQSFLFKGMLDNKNLTKAFFIKEYDDINNIITLSDNSNTIDIKLGYAHIYEYMAKICESLVFNSEIENSPINPYQILHLLIKKQNPFLLNNKLLLLAILESSLQTKNPIKIFYKLINENYSSINNINNIKVVINKLIINDLLSFKFDDLIKHVKVLYEGQNFIGMRSWLLNTIEKSKTLTQNNFFVITDLINRIIQESPKQLLLFASQEFSCPLISCNHGQLHFDQIAAASRLYYFKLIQTSILLLNGQDVKKCPNEVFCEAKKEHCFEAIKSIEAQEKLHGGLCPLGCVLKNYGYYEDK